MLLKWQCGSFRVASYGVRDILSILAGATSPHDNKQDMQWPMLDMPAEQLIWRQPTDLTGKKDKVIFVIAMICQWIDSSNISITVSIRHPPFTIIIYATPLIVARTRLTAWVLYLHIKNNCSVGIFCDAISLQINGGKKVVHIFSFIANTENICTLGENLCTFLNGWWSHEMF